MGRLPSALDPLRQVLSQNPPEIMVLPPSRALWSAVAGAKVLWDAGVIQPCAKHFGEVALRRCFHGSPQFFIGHLVSPADANDLLERRAEITTAAQVLQRNKKQSSPVAGGDALRAYISHRRLKEVPIGRDAP